MKSLDDFPRLELGLLPTPFYRLENVSKILEKNIFIKRDDMIGVALGGNKVRKLEYLLADAQSRGCDTVLTAGAAQSNHAMLTAACAARLGMTAILVLKKRGVCDYRGNLVLNDIYGADVRFVDTDDYADVYAEMDRISTELLAQGHKPYQVPVGGSTPLGSLGYVRGMREMYAQADALGVHIDHTVCCAGSGGTMAGTVLGTMLYSPDTRVTGVGVCDDPFELEVSKLVNGSAELLESDIRVTPEQISVFYNYGVGYAIPTADGKEAIRFLARKEGILVDPVYTGKTFAGMIKLIKHGYFADSSNIAFVHTGGAGSLFAIDM